MKKDNQNYLEKIPCYKSGLCWSQDEDGIVTLEMENRGVANRIAQKLLKKPKVSFIHLEEFGSFIWLSIDGKRDILAIGELVREKFGEKAEPLYERLAQYIKTLHSNGFISFN
ncbi:MAG: PqqD family protein [Clostridia bacterium]|nr:PqqD family protein [Clostridia bacterium]